MRHEVALVRNADAASAVAQAVNLLGGMRSFVARGERVLIKPNFLISENRLGVVTTGAVIAAVARAVLEADGLPIIGEAGSAPSGLDAFHNVGVLEFARQHNIPTLNLNEDESAEVEIPGARVLQRVKVFRTALEADKIISVPVLKTHDQCWVSLGIKNIKGILPSSEKMRSHQVGVEQAIVDLNRRFPPALVVIDGIWGLEGLGPAHGEPVPMNLIIAGANALATDLVGAAVMGFDPRRIKHLRYAAEAGLGPANLQAIRILGCPIDAVQRPFKTAQEAAEQQYRELGIRILAENVCSGCWTEFRDLYYSLKDERERLRGFTFVLGRVKNPPKSEKVVVLGNCARKAAACGAYCAGCPPHHLDIVDAVRRIIRGT